MGKQQNDELEVVVDLDDILEYHDEEKTEPNAVPPPPPKGEFEGWEVGEDDLT
jgi:hypothetical protein